MVTIVLIINSKNTVTYNLIDGNEDYRGQITVNKSDLSFKLKGKKTFTNSYETQGYRLIKECIIANKFPEKASKGWS